MPVTVAPELESHCHKERSRSDTSVRMALVSRVVDLADDEIGAVR